jgi:hypothetical protein
MTNSRSISSTIARSTSMAIIGPSFAAVLIELIKIANFRAHARFYIVR